MTKHLFNEKNCNENRAGLYTNNTYTVVQFNTAIAVQECMCDIHHRISFGICSLSSGNIQCTCVAHSYTL